MGRLGAIDDFQNGTYTLKRRAVGTTDSSGNWTLGSVTTSSIVALVQPVGPGAPGGAILRARPEGRYEDQVMTVHSRSAMRATPVPDIIVIDGEDHEIFEVEKWDAFGEIHYKAFASRRVVP